MLEAGKAYVIGRSGAVDILVPEGTVSRQHARIEIRADGSVVLSDMGSRHGTFVNGQRLTAPTRIGAGEDVRLTRGGKVVLALRSIGEARGAA